MVKEEIALLSEYQISRRRLLQGMGYGLAGAAGISLLAACGGSNQQPTPTPGSNATPTPGEPVGVNLGATRQISPYYLGYNAEAIHSPSWHDTTFAQACAKMKPAVLRYPGGTIANYWDWQTGLFIAGHSQNTPISVYRLEELQIAVRTTGAIPSYVLNMLTSGLSYQMEMLRTAQNMGLPIKLIELGNELSISQQDNINAFPTGGDYGRVASQWIAAIRAQFPDVRIAALGEIHDLNRGSISSRQKNWNQELMQTLHGADALVMHPYVVPTLVQGGQKAEFNAISSDSGRNDLLGLIYEKLNLIQNQFQGVPGNLNGWFTEYNLNDKIGVIAGTWLHGIFSASMTLAFLEQPRVEWVGYYDMIGKRGSNVIFPDSQGFRGVQAAGAIQTTPYALTAAGWTMQLLSETTYEMTSAQQLTFNPNPSLSTNAGKSFHALQGWLFSNGSRQAAYVVNRSPSSYSFPVQSIFSHANNYTQLTADPLTYVSGPNSVKQVAGPASGSITLPAFSVTQLT